MEKIKRHLGWFVGPGIVVPLMAFFAGLVVYLFSRGKAPVFAPLHTAVPFVVIYGIFSVVCFSLSAASARRLGAGRGSPGGGRAARAMLGAVLAGGVLAPIGVIGEGILSQGGRSDVVWLLAGTGLLIVLHYFIVSRKRKCSFLLPLSRFVIAVALPFSGIWVFLEGWKKFLTVNLIQPEFLALLLLIGMVFGRRELGLSPGTPGAFSRSDFARVLFGSVPFLLFSGGLWLGVLHPRHEITMGAGGILLYCGFFPGEIACAVRGERFPRLLRTYFPSLPLVLSLLLIYFSYKK